MSEKKIVVPKAMLEAAEHFDSCDQTEKVLEAALKWLSENPIVPSMEQVKSISCPYHDSRDDLITDVKKHAMVEWQRRMFLAPEPTIPEEVKDLLWDCDPCGFGDVHKDHNEKIIEAFQRGYRSAK